MVSFYTEMQELASELLTADDDNFGQSKTGNVINILTRSNVAGATAEDEPAVTFAPAQVPAVSRGVSARRDGEGMLAMADRLVTIAAAGVTQPSLKDKIEIAGVEFAIVSVEPSSNDGTVAVYRVYVKR